MHTHHHPRRPITAPASPRLLTGVIAAVALLTGACSETASINGPPLLHRSGGGSVTTAGFAVLANAAVTCTDGTISGDVGTYMATPTGSVTVTTCPIIGAVHVGDAAAIAAFESFLGAYDALAPQPGDICPIITGTLAGQSFAPGVYCISAEAKTGVLTLDGPTNGTWIFKVAPGAFTGTSFSVVLAGQAQACNVIWWVDAATTMTDSDLKGNVLSGAAITLTRGTFSGNAWSRADVTVTGTVVTGCEVRSGNVDHPKHPRHPKHEKCNQGVGNGREGCDPGNSNHRHGSNDEDGGTPGNPGRRGGR